MIYLDESDIQRIGELVREGSPEHYPFVLFLDDWRKIVNENSDGWAYWKSARSSASRLMNLLDQLAKCLREGKPVLPPVVFMRSLGSIRRLATMKNLPAPELRNLVASTGDPAESKPKPILGTPRRVED